jgi:adenine phosphoribosyltransferase
MDALKKLIREVPDFPKPGINFYDITTLVKDPQGLRVTIDAIAAPFRGMRVDRVVGMEARGFFFAPAVALELGAGFVPVRKAKKLPWKVEFWEYELEYGKDRLEIHQDGVAPGERILIVDDVLATGGTAAATVNLVKKLGGDVLGTSFVIELDFLNGREKLAGVPVHSLIHY